MNEDPKFGDRYSLVWLAVGSKIMGEVRNYTIDGNGARKIPIVLDDALMQRIKMRFLVTSMANQVPEIIVSKSFMLLKQSLREAGIWHEVGHVHHEHHLNFAFSDPDQMRAARIAATESGQILWQEAEADCFAVKRVGKDAILDFLNHALATRPTGGKLGWNDLGKRELELRVTAVQALRT